MKIVSTRNPETSVSFRDAIFQGLAPDGGLYVAEGELDLRKEFLKMDKKTSFQDIARLVAGQFLEAEVGKDGVDRIVKAAFPFSPKLTELKDGIKILELYHGPSCAFKDFGASFLASTMEEYLRGSSEKAVILTATSGDTGSAVAQAFHGKKNIDVVILYPSGRVSPLQEKQLTTLGGNVHALEVQGSFDDCQRMVKEAFQDPDLSRSIPLTSANSISLGRLLPQSLYYIWAFAQLKDQLAEDLVFCVPSGNFGNLTAGVYAWKWGLPVNSFLAATNRNDVVPQYLDSGIFQVRPSVLTPSNAMDVGNPSNFERLEYIFQKNWSLMRAMIQGDRVDDEQTLKTMKDVWESDKMDICPHTAVGVEAARRLLKQNPDLGTLVVLSTAHPAKFLEVAEKAVGHKPALPPEMQQLLNKEKVSLVIPPQKSALAEFLKKNFAK